MTEAQRNVPDASWHRDGQEETRRGTILFVDDEVVLLRGLRRSLHAFRDRFDLRYADGATAAMTELNREPVDILVTDMKMPVFDGAQLLETVREFWPQTIRFVLTGHASEERNPRAIPVAHHWLAKPCQRDVLLPLLERAFSLKQRLQSPRLDAALDLFEPEALFPETHRKATALLVEGGDPTEGIRELLESRPTIHSRFLELANSSWFSMPRIVIDLRTRWSSWASATSAS